MAIENGSDRHQDENPSEASVLSLFRDPAQKVAAGLPCVGRLLRGGGWGLRASRAASCRDGPRALCRGGQRW